MHGLLALSRFIDALNERIGRTAAWAIVAAAVISVVNAVALRSFTTNAWLEIQWWLFSIAFLLAAPWTLARNEHIRIDVLTGRMSPRTRNLIDLFGHVVFLVPVAAVLLVTSWRYFWVAYAQNQGSSDAGGLPFWPIKALIPIAFALLLLQAVSEIIKRIAVLRGTLDDPYAAPTDDAREERPA